MLLWFNFMFYTRDFFMKKLQLRTLVIGLALLGSASMFAAPTKPGHHWVNDTDNRSWYEKYTDNDGYAGYYLLGYFHQDAPGHFVADPIVPPVIPVVVPTRWERVKNYMAAHKTICVGGGIVALAALAAAAAVWAADAYAPTEEESVEPMPENRW
jgi:hypothetical protein